jgi:hypothetical protein
MEIKCNRLEWRSALVAGLFLNCGVVLEALLPSPVPCFSEWDDRTKLDSRVAIGSNIASIDKMYDLISSYIAGKSYNPNQMVMIGNSLPIIFFAACLPNPVSGDHPIRKLFNDNNTVITTETATGDTPAHVGAANSLAAMQEIIADGRLDINEHNNAGKTPLYVAMECNRENSHRDIILLITGCSRFLVNSRDNRGRTMLHVAVQEGNAHVAEQILGLIGTPYNGHTLNIDVVDDVGRTPADYLEEIADIEARVAIQNILHEVEATYANGGYQVTGYASGFTFHTTSPHEPAVPVGQAEPTS